MIAPASRDAEHPMGAPEPSQITMLLQRLSAGDAPARDELMELVYGALRSMAHNIAGPGGSAQTLQPTALVHEAWLKLGDDGNWEGRRHFFAVAAKAMRQILSNYSRDAKREKRGGAWKRVTLQGTGASAEASLDLVELDDALHKLGEADPELLQIFELHWLAGLDTSEVGELLGLGRRSIQLKWRAVRAFLSLELNDAG